MRDLFSRGLSLGFKVLQKFSEKVKDIDEQQSLAGQTTSTEPEKPVVPQPVVPDDPNKLAVKSLCFDDAELNFALGLLAKNFSIDEIKQQLNVNRLAPVLKQYCENFNMSEFYNRALEIFKENPAFTLVELQEIVKTLANNEDVQKVIEIFKANSELSNQNSDEDNNQSLENKNEDSSSEQIEEQSKNSGYDKDGYNALGYNKDGYNRKGFNSEGFNRQGYDIYGFDRNGYDKEGYDKKGFNVHGIDREGYDRSGFNSEGFNRDGFDVNGFDKNGYDEDGYNQEGYSAQGFDRAGFDKNGYDKNGYDKSGFNAQGYDKEGYDKQGFDANGIDRQGYNTQGYDKDGYNRNGINSEGYDMYGNLVEGYGRDGFDKDGYDREGYDREGYDKNGFNKEGYNRSGYNINGFNKEGFNSEGYDEDGFNKDGFNVYGFNKRGYDKDGYDRDGYDVYGFDRQGYDKNGYNTDGYNYDGYNIDGFDAQGYNKQGYDEDGFNKDGFNIEGYNKEGYNKEGYNREGYDKDGYNASGYNKDGINREGFNLEGYNSQGYDKDGYNKEGYNKDGFNKSGYNKDGYDKEGYNIEGYNKDGFDKSGYNKDGYDKDGYDKKGYNKDGYDRDGFNLIGYDKGGYDKDGYNAQGYNRDGFDVDGIDVQGYNREGLNSQGYDKNGVKTEVSYDSRGNRTTKYYENDKLTKSVHYDASQKTCTTTFYDNQGNKLPDAKSKLPNNDKAISKTIDWPWPLSMFKSPSVYTKSSQELYEGLTTKYDDKSFFSAVGGAVNLSARECVQVGWGEQTANFLGYAQVGYNGTPEGAKKLSSYQESKYSSFIQEKLLSSLKNSYGYLPEDITGYNFNSNSALSKQISSDVTIKNFIKSNITKLLAEGYSPDNTGAVTFNSTDLHNSINNAYVVNSNITGTKLSLSLFDIYDFDINSKDALGKAASAAMLDGNLVPYYTVIDLKIDLNEIFTDAELKELGINENTQSGVKVPETTPTVPESTTPTAPESTTPTVPESTIPAVPESTTPTVPENTTPIVPETKFPPENAYQTSDSKGNVTTDYYENGQIKKTVYYDAKTQACKTTFYDENGNPLPDKRSELPNNDKAISKTVSWPWPISKFKSPSVYTKSSQQLYDGLTSQYDDKNFFSAVGGAVNLSARECVEVGWGKQTADFLGYAQVGYNGTPSGATKIKSYKNTPESDYIEKSLLNTVSKDYGYAPEQVKGYNFSADSSISKQMANDATMKDFVKSNIKAILADSYSAENTGSMTFKNNEESKDLYNSIASITVIGSEVSGTNLKLNLFDIYDFDVNAKDQLNKTASAAMSDGKLIPYYAMFDVNIDLREIFTDAELRELGISV